MCCRRPAPIRRRPSVVGWPVAAAAGGSPPGRGLRPWSRGRGAGSWPRALPPRGGVGRGPPRPSRGAALFGLPPAVVGRPGGPLPSCGGACAGRPFLKSGAIGWPRGPCPPARLCARWLPPLRPGLRCPRLRRGPGPGPSWLRWRGRAAVVVGGPGCGFRGGPRPPRRQRVGRDALPGLPGARPCAGVVPAFRYPLVRHGRPWGGPCGALRAPLTVRKLSTIIPRDFVSVTKSPLPLLSQRFVIDYRRKVMACQSYTVRVYCW